jgi:opacity protein-like surface antigen
MDRKHMPKFLLAVASFAFLCISVAAQQAADKPQAAPEPEAGRQYSGMYTFLKEGEFVQITVEDDSRITGFISRYGSGESDQGAFLDQFFKTGKLEGNKLTFTTDIVHGVSFDFKGTIERGEGKAPGDEAYFVVKGTLTDKASDVNKKVTSHSREVVFKRFPEDAAPPQTQRQ